MAPATSMLGRARKLHHKFHIVLHRVCDARELKTRSLAERASRRAAEVVEKHAEVRAVDVPRDYKQSVAGRRVVGEGCSRDLNCLVGPMSRGIPSRQILVIELRPKIFLGGRFGIALQSLIFVGRWSEL